jgi:multiple sugar transport system permease protein
MSDRLRSADTGFAPTTPNPITPGMGALRYSSRVTRLKARLSVALYYLICSVLTLVFLFPIAWSAFTSFYSPADASASPPKWIPSHLSFENYQSLAAYGAGIWRYLGNSTSVAMMTVVMTLVLSTLVPLC